jgi:hypothetical protein
MEKKFEIIEEGRLKKSEMGNLIGGTNSDIFSCDATKVGKYHSDPCKITTTGMLAVCPSNYYNCSSTMTSCKETYRGNPLVITNLPDTLSKECLDRELLLL